MIALYKEWNAKINVISRKDEDNIYEHHILHSLAIARYFEILSGQQGTPENAALCSDPPSASLQVPPLTMPRVARFSEAPCCPEDAAVKILDVGTGGGFPGIPLATVMPDVQFTLCDSIGKKIKVAQAVSESLGLNNVSCVNCRAESLDETFDWVVSRAVTSLDNFYPWVRGKYTKGILYLKGGDVLEEISVLCRKFKLDPKKITVWPISDWISDDYFKEKFVIDIRK